MCVRARTCVCVCASMPVRRFLDQSDFVMKLREVFNTQVRRWPGSITLQVTHHTTTHQHTGYTFIHTTYVPALYVHMYCMYMYFMYVCIGGEGYAIFPSEVHWDMLDGQFL